MAWPKRSWPNWQSCIVERSWTTLIKLLIDRCTVDFCTVPVYELSNHGVFKTFDFRKKRWTKIHLPIFDRNSPALCVFQWWRGGDLARSCAWREARSVAMETCGLSLNGLLNVSQDLLHVIRTWNETFTINLNIIKDVTFSSAFCIPQFVFEFEFECEQPNGNLAVHKSFELLFGHSHSKI